MWTNPFYKEIAFIIPILKSEKDSMKSYRLTASINQDSKIFTTILANRTQNIISHYVKHEQTWFIPEYLIRY